MRIRLLPIALLALFLSPVAAKGQAVQPPPKPIDSPDAPSIDPDPAKIKPILDYLHAGKSKEALDVANDLLRSFPDSTILNCAAGEAAVEGNDRLAVHRALEGLKRTAPQEACVTRLETQYSRMTDSGIREQALQMVRSGDLDGARKLVAGGHLEPQEELIIEHFLDRAQAHFTNALVRLTQLARIDPSSAAKARSYQDDTMAQANDFSETRRRAQLYLFDPVATSSCSRNSEHDMFDAKGLTLVDFLEFASSLHHEYPSHPDAQQLYFMALILDGTQDALDRYGSSVLERYGRLSIPFFSRDSLYLLVIDRRAHRITLKENPLHPKNQGITDGLRAAEPFDMSYSQVASFRQMASSEAADLSQSRLSEKAVALDFGDQGSAPYYALMPAINCIYGERFQRRATARLGNFVAKEIGLPAARVKLVDPNATTHDTFGSIVTTLTAASMVASQAGLSRTEQEPTRNSADLLTSLQQRIDVQQVQSDGQAILDQQQAETGAIQEISNAQLAETDSLESQLAEEGFDLALDLDVPGYLEVLTDMLHKH
jgi:hypothetical protein